MSEYKLQKEICKYLDFRGVLYCGSMGGQYQKHFSQRIKAKQTGYKKGFPDIFIYEPMNQYAGMGLELKIGKNRASKDQKRWIMQLKSKGYYATVCTGIDETLETINKYLSGKIDEN